MPSRFSPGRSLLALTAAAFVIGASFALMSTATSAGAVQTADGTQGLPLISLNNDTAPVGEPGVDCPDDGLAYWHFVLASNDGVPSVFTVILNLRTGVDTTETLNFTGAQLVLNGGQTDNLYVAVPSGHSAGDLVALGSYATYTGAVPNEFNLSHTCDGTRSTTITSVVPVTTITAPTAATVTGEPVEVLGAVQASSTAGVEVLGSVQVANELPYTGANTTPFLITGFSVLVVGGVLAGMSRRRLGSAHEPS